MKFLVLGASGMLGFQLFRSCIEREINVVGTIRNKSQEHLFTLKEFGNIRLLDDVRDLDTIELLIQEIKPTLILNGVGIIKQSSLAHDYIESIKTNSLFPHELNKICMQRDIRLIHISTDCVFDGKRGMYTESDRPNAMDLYGKSKHLGEVDYGNAITLRTSIIGHEVSKQTHGLLEWFLKQNKGVNGFTNAFFSGLTTNELSRVILDFVVPDNLASGVYHISSKRISKFELLKTISEVYSKKIDIRKYCDFAVDRSLDASRFIESTNYSPPDWKM